jgi:hypothetical protein
MEERRTKHGRVIEMTANDLQADRECTAFTADEPS